MEQEYFVQLFLEFDERVKIPTVGYLLRKMFLEQNISFTEVLVCHLTACMCIGVHNIGPCPHFMGHCMQNYIVLLTSCSHGNLQPSVLLCQAPSQLLIQVPRFGKKFKWYDTTVPGLLLDIEELLPTPCQ